MLTRLAGLSDQNGDGDGAEPRASTDPYELATELILSVFRGEKDTGDLFTRINREEPAVGAEVAAIVRARAIDDLVNGMDPDEVRVQRLADLVRATGAGVRKLANPGTAGPWKELTAELEEVLKELVTSLDPEANERARNQVPDDDPT
jgi:NADPH-dependent 2,4-dienoyl-CoA reductase/sulfur reductase-like enzyme